jgi:hypothetical protein
MEILKQNKKLIKLIRKLAWIKMLDIHFVKQYKYIFKNKNNMIYKYST